MKPTNSKIMHSFKIIASKAGTVVFDDRVEAESPREAREKMKKALGLESLTGIVYAITEIPIQLIQEIVSAQLAQVVVTSKSGKEMDLNALVHSTVALVVEAKLREMEARIAALETGGKTKAQPSRFDPLASTSAPVEPEPEPVEAAPENSRAIVGPDWKAIRRKYEKTHSVKQTAAEFNLSPNTLKARIRREGWGK